MGKGDAVRLLSSNFPCGSFPSTWQMYIAKFFQQIKSQKQTIMWMNVKQTGLFVMALPWIR